MSEIWGKITDSFDNLKKKISGVVANPTPSPVSSNAMSIQDGGRRKRRGSKRSSSKRRGSKRKSKSRRKCGGSKSKRMRSRSKRTKKVRFSKKNKVYTYNRK